MDTLEYQNTQETKVHGHEDFPFNIYLCTIPLDFHLVPTHWHNDMEIIYIKKGRGIVSIDLRPFGVAEGILSLSLRGGSIPLASLARTPWNTKILFFSSPCLWRRRGCLYGEAVPAFGAGTASLSLPFYAGLSILPGAGGQP